MSRFNEWLTLLTNVELIAGVLFVGFEIRQNSQVASATIRQEVAHTDLQASLSLATDASLAEALAQARQGHELSAIQTVQLRALIYATHRRMENVLYQYQNGMISEVEWLGYCRNLARLEGDSAFTSFSTLENYSSPFSEFLSDVRDDPASCSEY